LSFNVSPDQVNDIAEIAIAAKIPRVIIAVYMPSDQRGEGVQFDEACQKMKDNLVAYTILKYLDNEKIEEHKNAYRIIPGDKQFVDLPDSYPLSSLDLIRVCFHISLILIVNIIFEKDYCNHD
jgi:hypothetical protein